MTDNIKELANLQVVLLGVTETNVLLQTESGKGVKTLTSADLSGGGGTTVATTDNIVMQDTDGTLFFKRVSSDTPPVLTNWKLSDGSAYTITGTPVPYGVTSVEVTGTVATTNGLTNTELRATELPVVDAGLLASLAVLQTTLDTTNLYLLADITTQTISFITSQAIAIGASSVSSATVSADTTRVILTSTVDCWVHIGTAPTATLDAPSFFLAAGVPSYPQFVTPSSTKIAGIAVSTAGTLSIVESA